MAQRALNTRDGFDAVGFDTLIFRDGSALDGCDDLAHIISVNAFILRQLGLDERDDRRSQRLDALAVLLKTHRAAYVLVDSFCEDP